MHNRALISRKAGVLITLIFFIAINLICCTNPHQSTTSNNSEAINHPSSPITGELSIEKAPLLNETVFLIYTFKSSLDAPDSTASIELPDGAVLVSGKLDWQGDLQKDVPVTLETTIKFIHKGKWTIKSYVRHVINDTNWLGNEDYLYLTIGAEKSQLGRDHSPTEQTVPSANDHPIPPQQYIPDPKNEPVLPLTSANMTGG